MPDYQLGNTATAQIVKALPADLKLEDLGMRVVQKQDGTPFITHGDGTTNRLGSVRLETFANVKEFGELITGYYTVPIQSKYIERTGKTRVFAGSIAGFTGTNGYVVTAALTNTVGNLAVKEYMKVASEAGALASANIEKAAEGITKGASATVTDDVNIPF
jgi:hypothetical protein